MKLDKWVALVFLCISLVYGYAAYSYPLLPFERNMVFLPNTMPLVLSVIGMLCSLMVLLVPSATGGSDDKLLSKDAELVQPGRSRVLQATLLIAAMILFALLLRPLGFLASASLFLAGTAWILGERRPIKMLVFAVTIATVIWWLVQEVLGIYLKPLP